MNELGLRELALFSGAGGGILGGYLLGWKTVAAVEIEDYPRAVLLQRQVDGILPRFPIWDDIRTFDGHQWRGMVDVISGGFPCQDVSAAGKGAGITGERSGLWKEMARIVGEVRPRYVFVENSPVLTSRGLGDVLGDLASMGYDAEWCVLGADDAGAPHRRKRIWILGHTDMFDRRAGAGREDREKAGNSGDLGDAIRKGLEGLPGNEPDRGKPRRKYTEEKRPVGPTSLWWRYDPADLPDTIGDSERSAHREPERVSGRRQETAYGFKRRDIRGDSGDRDWLWPVESRVGRVAHGVPNRVDRVKAIGNAQVPAVVALAWETLMRRIG